MRIIQSSISSDFICFICFIIFCFALFSCGSTISFIEKESNQYFRVKDPNASYFNVKERMMYIRKPIMSTWFRFKWSASDCEQLSPIEPVDYYLVMPAFYENRTGWRKANAPLEIFETHVTHLAELYVTKADNSYAMCLAKTLSEWAEEDSLLAFDYYGNHKQAWYAIVWTTSSAALAYSIVRDNPSIESEIKHKIEIWLKKVVEKQISYPGGPKSCCNNHSYWRGLVAVITGVVTNDNSLFRYGISKYISAMKSMNSNGSFPLEMARGRRALKYQNFAILPLVYIAEIAAQQGYDLYGLNIDGKDIHLAIKFLMNCIKDKNNVKGCPRSSQYMSFTYGSGETNWMEPYNRRFKNEKIVTFLKGRRPLYHRWAGGNSTLYFYSPEIQ